jgi:hypothetical protein
MKFPVHISVLMVQYGRTAALLRNNLLHYGGKFHSLVSTGCILKGTPYHDAVQRATNSSHHPAPHSWADTGLKVSMMLRCKTV